MAKRASRPAPKPQRPTAATSGKSWRQAREEGELWTLPSGNVARLRPISLMHLIRSGDIPDILTPVAASMLWDEIDIDKLSGTVEMAKNSAELAERICEASFINPRIVENPEQDDEVALEHIDDMDKAWVMNTMIQPAEVLRGFRMRQEERLAALHEDDEGELPAE